MEQSKLLRILEGVLLAAGAPLSVSQIKELFDEPDKPAASEIRDALKVISSKYSEAGFELKEVASGFRFQIRDELSPWVSKLWQERPQKYSRALLETLSLSKIVKFESFFIGLTKPLENINEREIITKTKRI